MPPSKPKRRRGGASSRGRKKHKRLDAIHDVARALPPPSPGGNGGDSGDGEASDAEARRRSTRVRRAPVLLDTSPLPSPRRKRPCRGGGGFGSSGGSRRGSKGRSRDEADDRETEEEDEDDAGGNAVWRSRLRDRVKGKTKLESRARSLWFGEDDNEYGEDEGKEEEEEARMVVVDVHEGVEDVEAGEEIGGFHSQGRELKDREINLTIDLNVESHEGVEGVHVDGAEEGEGGGRAEEKVVAGMEDEEEEEKGPAVGMRNDPEEGKEEEMVEEGRLQQEEKPEELELPVLGGGNNGDELACEEGNEEIGARNSGGIERLGVQSGQFAEESDLPVEQQMELDHPGPVEQEEDAQRDEKMDHDPDVVLAKDGPKEKMRKSPVSDEKLGVKVVKEGRRCGLCGGGTDGKPPKIALHDAIDSDNEAYEGVLPSEEPNYDMWDGFGDDSGWLGRLLGPIHDRFGIARVWVHQNCAVWSPEVYFAGLGCLRNVRAALCRGRLLKCSRCGRPGATIGCRVDRCPKTYHLPCSRAEACVFDHRKFLIACNDHRHLFQPQGDKYIELIRKMKIKKMKADISKLSHDAWRKDREAEEKWLENCGEDEEFLKREGKRLNRDLLRIAPVYIGGSAENEKSYQGWESVAGLSDVIQSMKEVVILPLLYPEFFSSLGLAPPRGILLHGHPGTGKTLVVRALIGACSQGNRRIAYFARKGADCLGKYVGDAERQLRLLFQVAERCQPSIIFFDEIDGLAPCRSRRQDQTHNSVVATLLSLLDGLKSRGSVIVIGATNRPDAIDPALRRPGRFDREIYFPLPTFEDRSAILSLHTKSWPSPISGAFLSLIASQTVGYAGADLQAICTQAAINALKRTCPLHKILQSAEEEVEHGRVLLPSVLVEERDWLVALAVAPPPCSQREAGIAATDLVSSPLDSCLVPSLLKPLVHLLISFCLDERVWLPSSLLKASGSIKEIVFSSMERNNVPHTFWSSYLHSLIQQKDIANRIGTILSSCGLVRLGNHCSLLASHVETHENFGCSKFGSRGSHMKGGLPHKLSGFRVLVAGAPRSGQQHLIRCLLHGFMGQTVIHKLDLATMAQEGNGDILSGLTQILLKCVNLGRCIIYMPRIDLWAVNKVHSQIQEHMLNTEPNNLASSSTKHIQKCSEVWNALVEQMDSLLASVSISVLSTSDLRFQDLPSGVRGFFSAHVVDQCLVSSEHTIPRFSLNIDSCFSWDEMIDSCALQLSHDLIQHHVQFLHERSHKNNHDEQKEVFASMEISAPGEPKSSENKQSPGVASREITQLAPSSSLQESAPNVKDKEKNVQKIGFEDTIQRNPSNRVVKGSESLAIMSFGIQILQHPQFSKLCWVTSKLREGPCTDINGPWKGWPFNSCLLHSTTSSDNGKSLNGGNNVVKGKENALCVRGLVAVGLLAYRGFYSSVMEVCAEVRKVLELLVGHIRTKILEKRNQFRYFHILSQVAYLDDIVNSWAYTFQRFHIDNTTRSSCTKIRSCPNECQSTKFSTDASAQIAPSGNRIEAQDIPAQNTLDHEVVPTCPNEMQDNPLQHYPDRLEIHTMVCDHDDYHVMSISSRNAVHSASPAVNKGNSTHADTATNEEETNGADNDEKIVMPTCNEENCRSDIQIYENTESIEHLNDLQRAENSVALSANADNTEISRNHVSAEAHGDDNVLKTNNPLDDLDSGHLIDGELQDNTKNPSLPKSSCLYKCCSACFHAVYKMVHDNLSNSLRPNHCLTVDDMHDILSSWSLNLLSTVRKYYSTQDMVNCEEYFGKMQNQGIRLEHCACQIDATLLPRECICHMEGNEDDKATNTDCHSLFGQKLNFFFKDGVWMPSDHTAETTLHCSFRRLCICSVLGTISMFSQISS